MTEEIITNLYTKFFAADRLQEFLALLSDHQKLVEEAVPIRDDYSQVAVQCQHLLTCWDHQGQELPVYWLQLQPEGRLLDLDQEFISRHFSDHPHLLVAVCRPEQTEWQLVFCRQELVLARIYYYTCGNQFSCWWQTEMESLAKQRKVVWNDLESAFAPQKLREQFVSDCELLIKQLQQVIGEQEAQNLILQLVVLFFLQQHGWLGTRGNWGEGDKNLLLTLYQRGEEAVDYWSDYLRPLLSRIFKQGQAEEDYFGYRVPCLGATARLLAREEPIPDDLLKKIIVTFNQYYFSCQENTPWRQQVALTPKVLSDLFERLSKGDQQEKRGVVYTPPEIVNYLLQEGIVNYLVAKDNQLEKETLTRFVYYGELPAEITGKAAVLDRQLAELKLCDPAVGSGAFAVGAQQEIVKLRRRLSRAKGDLQPVTELRQKTAVGSIHGVELNQAAVKIARLRLWFNSVSAENDYTEIDHLSSLRYKCVVGNSLLTKENNLFAVEVQEIKKLQQQYLAAAVEKRQQLTRQIDSLLDQLPEDSFSFLHYFPPVFSKQSGFDLIVGNPPYVGEKGNKELFRQLKESPLGRFYQGKMDLFYFFFHLGLDLAAEDGHLVYITTNYFLRATGAQTLRRDLKNRATVKKLINFNELKLFRAAIGQHNLISVLQKGRRSISARTVVTERKGMVTTEDLSYLLYGTEEQTKSYLVPQASLYEGKADYLRLQQGTVSRILARINKQGMQLGELCRIKQGIVTGCDRISRRHLQRYDLNLETGRGVFVVDSERKAEFDLENKEQWFRPWFKNSHIAAWTPQQETPEKYLLYLNQEIEELPAAIRDHLLPAREVLSERREVRQGRINWWHLQWPREQEMFTGPKLIAPQRHRYNIFAYTEEPWYASADVYYITQRQSVCDLKYLLALLNSELYYLWLYRKGKKKGDILELYQRPLTEVPIKVVSAEQQQKFIEKVEKIRADKQQLQELSAISWPQLLPAKEAARRELQEVAVDYQVCYQGQAQKVREIKVELKDKTGVIYSSRDQEGWYKLLRLQLRDRELVRYLKYHLENLPDKERRTINKRKEGIVNRVLQIKLPLYSSGVRRKVIAEWEKIVFERSKLQRLVTQKESQIDKLVYELYGLEKAAQKKIKAEIGKK